MTGRGFGMVLVAVMAAAALVPVGGAAETSYAGLQGFRCRQASIPRERTVEVTAVMRPVSGTQWMQLKFQLLERPAGMSWSYQVQGGDLGRWRRPNPASFGRNPNDVWMVTKPVSNLEAPAVYRFRVKFRWLDGTRHVIGVQTVVSPACVERR